jgi:hypothetical protein
LPPRRAASRRASAASRPAAAAPRHPAANGFACRVLAANGFAAAPRGISPRLGRQSSGRRRAGSWRS